MKECSKYIEYFHFNCIEFTHGDYLENAIRRRFKNVRWLCCNVIKNMYIFLKNIHAIF